MRINCPTILWPLFVGGISLSDNIFTDSLLSSLNLVDFNVTYVILFTHFVQTLIFAKIYLTNY